MLPDLALLDALRAADRSLARQGRPAPREVLVTTPPRPSVPTASGRCLGTMVKLHGAMARSAPRAVDTTGIPSAANQVCIRTIVVSHHRSRSPVGLHRGRSATAPPPVTHGTADNVRSSTQMLPQGSHLGQARSAVTVHPCRMYARQDNQASNDSAPAQVTATSIVPPAAPSHPPPPHGSARAVMPTVPET